jgi:very-short-patch-repair endonuclease
MTSGGARKHLARQLRSHATDAEQHLWRQLRARQIGGAKFRRQHPIAHYIVDFVCLEKRLIVEADGGQHVERQALDAKRSAFLAAQGFRVLRFWNDEVLTQTEDVLEAIIRALNEPPHPNPLPKGERE